MAETEWKGFAQGGVCYMTADAIGGDYHFKTFAIGAVGSTYFIQEPDAHPRWGLHQEMSVTFVFDHKLVDGPFQVEVFQVDEAGAMFGHHYYNWKAYEDHNTVDMFIGDVYTTTFSLVGSKKAFQDFLSCVRSQLAN